MTTVHHSPHGYHADLTSVELNRPLGELDAAIETVITTGSGVSTSLTAQAGAGQASLTVASSAGFAPGDSIYIGTGAMFEGRIVNTAAGVTITVTVNLTNTYASGKPVSKSPVEIVDARGPFGTLGARIKLLEDRVYDVKVYGADPTGATDSSAAIAATHADLIASGKPGVVSLGSGTYKITSTLTIDAAMASLVGNGAVIDASAILTTPAIYVTGTDHGWGSWNNGTQRIEGFRLIGPGTEDMGADPTDPHRYVEASRDGSVGILFDGTPTACPSHVTISNLAILKFDHGVDFGNSAYLLHFRAVNIFTCNIGMYGPDGTDNRENTSFSGCTIFNNWCAVGATGYELLFSACSFDFNTIVMNLNGSNCGLVNCHVEGGGNTSYAFTLTGWQAAFTWYGGSFAGVGNPAAIFDVNDGATVHLDGVFMNSVLTSTGEFASGDGKVTFSNMSGGNSAALIGAANNVLGDGSFEEATICDDWFISGDTAAITDRNTGANITLAISSVAARTGTQSLKIGKTGNNTTAAAAIVVAPIKRGSRSACSFWHKKPNAGTGSAWFKWGVCNVRVNGSGVPYLNRRTIYGAEQITWTAAWTDWTESYIFRDTMTTTPPWATHFYMEFDLGGFNGPQDIYIDDMNISEM